MPFCQVKYFVLSLLVVQNTCSVLLMRYSRTRTGIMYLSSTAVCCDEALKLVTCLGILVFTYLCQKRKNKGETSSPSGDSKGSYSQLSVREEDITNDVSCCVPVVPVERTSDEENDSIVQNANSINTTKSTQEQTMIRGVSSVINESEIDITQHTQSITNHDSFQSYLQEQLQFDIRVAVIAGLYTVQKNLVYLAISNLDANVFQVTYQAKVLITALFSVVLLKRKLSAPQILALILLTMGVALVQLDKVEDNAGVDSYQDQNHWVGLAAILGACCTSGFGGVYFELVLKPKQANGSSTTSPSLPPPSVWAKNVQLSAFGFMIALFAAFAKDHGAILDGGFFQGYSPLVLNVIALQSGGGLIVAATIKYADNILKSFATGASIVTSTLVSEWLFGFSVTEMFAWGCVLQFVAIWLYSKKGDNGGGGCCTSESIDECKLPMQTSEDIGMNMISSGDGNRRFNSLGNSEPFGKAVK